MDKPLVSAIIATRNRPEWLERAVRSVAEQTYRNVEAVVVDENDPESDGRDATRNVVDRLRDRIAITYLDERTPSWVCRARNEGVDAARGTYVAFLDDDDWWRPEKITRQVAIIEAAGSPVNGGAPDRAAADASARGEIGLVYTGLEVVDADGSVLKNRILTGAVPTIGDLLRENVIGTPSSVLMPKDLFLDIGGFDPVLPTRHDLDLYIRVAQRKAIAVVPDPLTVYLNAQMNAMSKDFDKKIAGRELVYRKYEHYYRDNARLRAFYLYGTALLCLKHGDLGQARRALRTSISAFPHPRAIARLVLTYVAPRRKRLVP